jgi:hypothetical protein
MTGNNHSRAALAAAILIVIAAAGWLYWRSTPRHAFGRIQHAIAAHDLALFREYVDLDAMLGRALTALGAGKDNPASGGMAALTGQFMVTQAKAMIETWVESGTWPAEGDSAGPGLGRLRDFEYRGVGKSEDGLIALKFHHAKYDRDLEVVLGFESAGWGRPRLVEIANLAALAEELARMSAERREAANRPIREKIATVLSIGAVEKRISGGFWVADQRYHLWLPAANTGSQTITALAGEVFIRSATEPGLAKKIAVRFDPIELAPGLEQTLVWTVTVGAMDRADQVIYSTPLEQLQLSFTPTRVTFADGSSLAVPEP